MKFELETKSMAKHQYDSQTASMAGKKSSRKGIPNKSNSELKEFFNSLLEGNKERLRNEFEKLEGKAFIDAYERLSEYVIPKLSRTDLKEIDDDNEINITIRHVDGEI